MKSIALVIGLVCTAAASCSCSTMPTVSAQVISSPTSVQYVYTLTNTLASPEALRDFGVFMPEVGARKVVSFTASSPWYSNHSFRGDQGSFWALSALIGDELQSGETLTVTLVTGPDVPTVNGFVADWPGNWTTASPFPGTIYYGDTSLPVPAPEPSGLLALAGGIAGLAGLALRRRRA